MKLGRARAALVLVAVLLGAAAPVAQAKAARTAKARYQPQVVVAVADLEINPYHRAFYRPQNTAHPCTWVTGFSCDVPALKLSVGKHKHYYQAAIADRQVWAEVEPNQWYWIPKTNIIGYVCNPESCFADEYGEGTAAASSVVSEAPDALLLFHSGWSTAIRLQEPPVVPDVQTHSWQPVVRDQVVIRAQTPLPSDVHDCPAAVSNPATQYFAAAGNYLPQPAVADCLRRDVNLHVVGGASPGNWNYDNPPGSDFTSWMCRPAAQPQSFTAEFFAHCGTSMSSGTAAGTAAAALLGVRRHDRYSGRSTAERVSTTVTREAFVAALRNGASYAPKPKYAMPDDARCTWLMCKVGWAPMPAAAHLFWGYGWLDSTVAPQITACALGRECPAKPAEAQAYLQARETARGAIASAP